MCCATIQRSATTQGTAVSDRDKPCHILSNHSTRHRAHTHRCVSTQSGSSDSTYDASFQRRYLPHVTRYSALHAHTDTRDAPSHTRTHGHARPFPMRAQCTYWHRHRATGPIYIYIYSPANNNTTECTDASRSYGATARARGAGAHHAHLSCSAPCG